MTRDEQLAACKQRAMESVKRGDLARAVEVMIDDMRAHPETAPLMSPHDAMFGMLYAADCTRADVVKWIEGFE